MERPSFFQGLCLWGQPIKTFGFLLVNQWSKPNKPFYLFSKCLRTIMPSEIYEINKERLRMERPSFFQGLCLWN